MNHPSKLRVLAIDPSTNDVGWCFFTRDIVKSEALVPGSLVANEYETGWQWGVCHLSGWNLLQRCKDLVHQLYEQDLPLEELTHLIIEWPMFYESTKGQIAAQEGYTINLAAVGCYLAGWLRIDVDQIELITAPKWKGNASKNMTARRFFRKFNLDPLQQVDHNAVDATMLLYQRASHYGWMMPLVE